MPVETVPGRPEKEPVDEGPQQALFGGTTAFVSEAIVVIVLLCFLLASGDLFLRKPIKVLPTFKDKKQTVGIAREMEHNISTYLFTVTVINMGVGVAVGVGVWLLKMPNPVLWGVLACVLTYIPYLRKPGSWAVTAEAVLACKPSITRGVPRAPSPSRLAPRQ